MYQIYAMDKNIISTFPKNNAWMNRLTTSSSSPIDDACLYLMIDHFPGGNLMQILAQKQPKSLSESQAKFYIAQLAATINYIHSSDIVLRDLSPKHILIQNNGHIKLTDLNIDTPINNELISKYGEPNIKRKINQNMNIIVKLYMV